MLYRITPVRAVEKIHHVKLSPEMVLQRRLFHQRRIINMCISQNISPTKIVKQMRIFNTLKGELYATRAL